MDRERYRRVRELVLQALAQPESSRDAWLAEACAGAGDLEAEVRDLLAREHSSAGLERRILPSGLLPPSTETPRPLPDHIGPYRILGLLGEGGMGVVYRARQEEPIRREVAVKVLRVGLGADRVLERFAWERRTLARMDHPHIARILDAGSADGQPYVVLELVDGEPITQWAEERDPDLATRLATIISACRAVQHAHERGILHRDLKPGNILVRQVDGRPVPSVIDFGIAKALDETDGDLTLEGQRIGTPAYMSPEQLAGAGRAVDVRTDVFALGCVLHELVTGSRLERGGAGDAPRAPSQVAGSEVRWRRRLRGDLDRICLMALRAEPERRYAGAGHLADDLERYLAGRPVNATPDSLGYRARKAARRHPLRVAMVTAALGFVVASLAFLGYHADRLAQEKRRALSAEADARAEAAAAAEIAGFLERLFTDADPVSGGAAETSARELLDQGALRLENELASQPRVRGRLYGVLGRVMHGLGVPDRSAELLQRSLEDLAAGDTTVVALERAEVFAVLGTTLHDLDRFTEAETASRRALALYREAQNGPTTDQVWALVDVATNIQVQGRIAEAQALMEEAVALGAAVGADADRAVAWTRNMLGYMLAKTGRYHEARDVFREAYRAQRALITGDDYELVNTLNNLGNISLVLGDLREAERRATEAVEMLQRMYEGDHPAVARALANLGSVRLEQERFAEADSLLDLAVAMNHRVLGDRHRRTLDTRVSRARVHQRLGRLEAAAVELREAKALQDAVLGPENPRTLRTLVVLGNVYRDQGAAERSRDELEKALGGMVRNLAPGHPRLAELQVDLAETLRMLGEDAAADSLLVAAVPRLETVYGTDDRRTRRALALQDPGR